MPACCRTFYNIEWPLLSRCVRKSSHRRSCISAEGSGRNPLRLVVQPPWSCSSYQSKWKTWASRPKDNNSTNTDIGIASNSDLIYVGWMHLVIGGHSNQIKQRRIEVQQTDHTAAFRVGGHPRRFDDERCHPRPIPKGMFLEGVFFAHMIAVVAPEHHDRICVIGARVQCIQDQADLASAYVTLAR